MSGLSDPVQAFYSVVYYLAFNFGRAVLAFLQRDSYLYWPFILSTLLIALVVSRRRVLRAFFAKRIWAHDSARADYRLYFANALMLPLVFGWLMFGDAQVGALVDAVLGRRALAAPEAGWPLRVAYTVAFFLVYDFGRFVAHCLLHDVPVLWEFHKVHHSAEVLTPITAYRVHPVDLLVMAWVPAVLTGLVTWAFNALSGGAVGFFTFLGLHVALWAVNLVDNLRHSHVWLTYGPVVGRWLVSPAHHQLHHSCEPEHIGCNRGFSIALWDRLYGTLRMPRAEAETFRMGLGDGTESGWHTVRAMYLRPFAGAAAQVRARLRRHATS